MFSDLVHGDSRIEDWSKDFIYKVQKMISEVEGATFYVAFKRIGRNNNYLMVEVSLRIERDFAIFQHEFDCGEIRKETVLAQINDVLNGFKNK